MKTLGVAAMACNINAGEWSQVDPWGSACQPNREFQVNITPSLK